MANPEKIKTAKTAKTAKLKLDIRKAECLKIGGYEDPMQRATTQTTSVGNSVYQVAIPHAFAEVAVATPFYPQETIENTAQKLHIDCRFSLANYERAVGKRDGSAATAY